MALSRLNRRSGCETTIFLFLFTLGGFSLWTRAKSNARVGAIGFFSFYLFYFRQLDLGDGLQKILGYGLGKELASHIDSVFGFLFTLYHYPFVLFGFSLFPLFRL